MIVGMHLHVHFPRGNNTVLALRQLQLLQRTVVARDVAAVEEICAGLNPRHRLLNARDSVALHIRWHTFSCKGDDITLRALKNTRFIRRVLQARLHVLGRAMQDDMCY